MMLPELQLAPVPAAPRPAPRLALANPLGFENAHLIGIGGAGMSALAKALLAFGVKVTGSDPGSPEKCSELRRLGALIATDHSSANLALRDAVVVISSAIRADNPELMAARVAEMRILHRAELLGLLLARRKSVLVAGTHGKTTTSALVALLLEAGGLDPWAFIGGDVPAFGGNLRVGGMEWAVAEADESDGSFLKLPSDHLIVTNIETDHLDYWGDEQRLVAGFRERIETTAPGGYILVCCDNDGTERIHAESRRVLGYSVHAPRAEFAAANIAAGPLWSEFDFLILGCHIRRFRLGVPGLHNVSNAVAALGMAVSLGAKPERLGEALEGFHGVGRRFQVLGESRGVMVIDDYAHHPTEIAATIAAASELRSERGGRLVVVFQPHRFTRTRDLLDGFAACFAGADEVVLTSVYAAGEAPIKGIDAQLLARRVRTLLGKKVRVMAERPAIADTLVDSLEEDDVVLCLGAGDNYKTARELLETLDTR